MVKQRRACVAAHLRLASRIPPAWAVPTGSPWCACCARGRSAGKAWSPPEQAVV